MLTDQEIQALKYILNTRGVGVEDFDEDHYPIGPTLRRNLTPVYMEVAFDTKKLYVTARGHLELEKRK